MSDSSSHATQPSESDFHDSHPIDDALDTLKNRAEKTTPSIGDLTSIESNIGTPSEPHSIGDLSSIGNTDNTDSKAKSEILGDISLLDEAFAEMDEGGSENDSNIPVLSEVIDAPSESRILPVDANASIPLLDQEATVYAEMLKPATGAVQSKPTSQVTDIEADSAEEELEEEPLFDSPGAKNNSNISHMHDSLQMAAELMSEAVPLIDQSEADENSMPEITSFGAEDDDIDLSQLSESDDAALEALLNDDTSTPEYNDPNIESEISDLELDIASEIHSSSTSIDEKIAIASGHTEPDINELPISSMADSDVTDSDISEPSDFPSSFAEGLSNDSTLLEETDGDLDIMNLSEISEFNPETDLSRGSATQASHSIGVSGQRRETEHLQNNLNLSIPFELHSQLSSKIDELVIEATSSITEELHAQLTARLDILLGNAVETVLPKLVNQMAIELRTEVNGRVKQQLPTIINDVLNKTRLQK